MGTINLLLNLKTHIIDTSIQKSHHSESNNIDERNL